MEIDMKKVWDPKAMIFAVWNLTPSLEQFASKSFGKGLIKPLVQNSRSNFHNRTLSSHKSWDESNRIMKSQQTKKKKKKIDPAVWGLQTKFEPLEPRRRIKP